MRRVLIITGPQGSGKSMLADFISDGDGNVNIFEGFNPNTDAEYLRAALRYEGRKYVVVSHICKDEWPADMQVEFAGCFLALRGIS